MKYGVLLCVCERVSVSIFCISVFLWLSVCSLSLVSVVWKHTEVSTLCWPENYDNVSQGFTLLERVKETFKPDLSDF